MYNETTTDNPAAESDSFDVVDVQGGTVWELFSGASRSRRMDSRNRHRRCHKILKFKKMGLQDARVISGIVTPKHGARRWHRHSGFSIAFSTSAQSGWEGMESRPDAIRKWLNGRRPI